MRKFKPTRREVLKYSIGTAVVPLIPQYILSVKANQHQSHGLSVFGDLKYSADFTNFDYVNPNAPKGGSIIYPPSVWYFNQNPQTFNTLNGFVSKGDAPPRIEICFDTLMKRAFDEPDANYGLLAESIGISSDGNRYVFKLRPEARFHDGSPLTAEDVAWSIEKLKSDGHPSIKLPLDPLSGVEVVSKEQVEIVFDGTQSKQLILTIANFPIFSKSYYADRDFTESTLDPPLASGPYRIGDFSAGKYIEYARVEDYWAKDLPVCRGHYNFDVLRLEFFKDSDVSFEALKKGELTYREEYVSKSWATKYDFPALSDGRVVKTHIPGEKLPEFQVWHVNTRREKFADPRTREAIGLCFDFEWTNQNIFYGAYTRSASYFELSPYKAVGKPSDAELALLEPYRNQLLPSVFEEAYVAPTSDGSGTDRKNLRHATKLLTEAGWTRDDGILVNSNGTQLTVEFLIRYPSYERLLGKFVQSLKAIGIDATIRLVDPAQYQSRLNDFDFDLIGSRLRFTSTPLEALEPVFGSEAADTPSSRNYSGVANPAVDHLIEIVENSSSRDEMAVALMALDRILRAYHFSIHNWHSGNHRVAYWDKFSFPDNKPDYFFPFESIWWEDGEKAAKLKNAG